MNIAQVWSNLFTFILLFIPMTTIKNRLIKTVIKILGHKIALCFFILLLLFFVSPSLVKVYKLKMSVLRHYLSLKLNCNMPANWSCAVNGFVLFEASIIISSLTGVCYKMVANCVVDMNKTAVHREQQW